jgi:hypothetical protein
VYAARGCPAQSPRFLAGTALAAILGCGGSGFDGGRQVPLEEVPAPVMNATANSAPGVKFDRAFKGRYKGEDAYEIQGITERRQVREVDVTGSGKVFNIE